VPSSRSREQGEQQDCFVVFVRDGAGASWRPGAAERAVASCHTYEEAVGVREKLRQQGKTCIIRFVGVSGGGD